jgi:TonB family protein
MAVLVVLGGVLGAIFFMKSRSASFRNANENYNRRARVDPTPYEEDSAPPTSSPGGRTTTGRKAPISGGVLNANATSLPKPAYPAIAKATRASGAVVVQVTVDETGKVTDARAVSGHPLLRAAAEQAARQARFTPTLLSGQPVKVTGLLTYNFAPE